MDISHLRVSCGKIKPPAPRARPSRTVDRTLMHGYSLWLPPTPLIMLVRCCVASVSDVREFTVLLLTPVVPPRKQVTALRRALSSFALRKITGVRARSTSRTSVQMFYTFLVFASAAAHTSSIIVGRARPWMVGAWRRTSRHRAPPRLPLPTASAARDLRQGSRLPSPRPPLTPPRRSPPPGRRRLTHAALTVVEMVWEVASRSGRDQVEIRR